MGMFFTNCQIRSNDPESCRKAAAGIVTASCVVTDSKNGWVTLFDEKTESQDENELQRVAKALSSELKTAVFGFLVHDSDIFMYFFSDRGKLVDQFNSHPDYFGPVSSETRKKWAGQFKKLTPFTPKKTSVAAIETVLRKQQTFEEHRVAEFARLMGIDEERACSGFKYFQETPHGFPLLYGKNYSADSAALVAAVRNRDLEKVRALLKEGVSPNAQDRVGYSLVVSALTSRQTEIVIVLLEGGADPFFGDHGDALWAAASHGNRVVLAKILEKSSDRLKASLPAALTNAVMMGQGDIVEDLLKAGADPNSRDKAGRTPLMAACSRGMQMVWEIFAGQKYPVRPNEKPTDWMAMVDTLLEAGADVNAQDNNGTTALMAARGAGQNQIVEKLLQAGANPNLEPDPEKLQKLANPLKSALEADAGKATLPGMSHLDPQVREALLKLLNCKRPKK